MLQGYCPFTCAEDAGPSTHQQHGWLEENDEKITGLLESFTFIMSYQNDFVSVAKIKKPLQCFFKESPE